MYLMREWFRFDESSLVHNPDKIQEIALTIQTLQTPDIINQQLDCQFSARDNFGRTVFRIDQELLGLSRTQDNNITFDMIQGYLYASNSLKLLHYMEYLNNRRQIKGIYPGGTAGIQSIKCLAGPDMIHFLQAAMRVPMGRPIDGYADGGYSAELLRPSAEVLTFQTGIIRPDYNTDQTVEELMKFVNKYSAALFQNYPDPQVFYEHTLGVDLVWNRYAELMKPPVIYM